MLEVLLDGHVLGVVEGDLVLRFVRIEMLLQAVATSPARTRTGCRNAGPSHAKLWNSPFSPQGSTPAGRSRSRASSKARPAKLAGSTLGSTQVRAARWPLATISRASSGVGRPQSGNSGTRPVPAMRSSR